MSAKDKEIYDVIANWFKLYLKENPHLKIQNVKNGEILYWLAKKTLDKKK